MVRKAVLLLPLMFLLGGCSLAPRKSGIEVVSNPSAKIYLDGKEAGMTPYKNSSLQPGEIEVRIVPEKGNEWSRKLMLQNYTTTVIERQFGDEGETAGGYLLYMERTGDKSKAGMIVNTNLDKASVFVENEFKGYSPMKIDDFGEGDKHVSITYPGYKSVNIFVKAVKSYQLVIEADLAVEKADIKVPETEANQISEKSITLSSQPMVTIKETETGWLRVRETPSSSSAEVGRVNPGEKYKLLTEQQDWYQIEMGTKNGWISSRYAEKD